MGRKVVGGMGLVLGLNLANVDSVAIGFLVIEGNGCSDGQIRINRLKY